MFKHAGFVDIELVADTGFNSSPVTKGALFLAQKKLQENALASLAQEKAVETHILDEEETPHEQLVGST